MRLRTKTFAVCSSQPSSIYWLNSCISPCCWFVVCPAMVSSSPLDTPVTTVASVIPITPVTPLSTDQYSLVRPNTAQFSPFQLNVILYNCYLALSTARYSPDHNSLSCRIQIFHPCSYQFFFSSTKL